MEECPSTAGAQCQRYEEGGIIRLVGMRRVRVRTVDRSARGTGQDALSNLKPLHLLSIAPAASPVVPRIRADRGPGPQ